MRVNAVHFFIYLLALGPTAAIAEGERFLSYSGAARARQSDEFLYGEKHFLMYRDDRIAERVVLYVCQNGLPFARKTVSYSDLFAPDFQLEDKVSGIREGVRTDDRGRTVFFRRNRIEAENSKPLPSIQGLVADAGFDEFIHARWSEIMTGHAVKLRFLVPSRLSAMSFAAQRLRSDTLNGVPSEVIRLKLDGVFGDVFASIDVAYSTNDHVLLRYEGVSDLRDASGKNYQAMITFDYLDRREGGSAMLAAARDAPLAACK